MDVELHKNSLPSNNEQIINALNDVKVKDAEKRQIGIKVSDAIDRAIFHLGLNKEATDINLLKLAVIDDVKENFPLLGIDEVHTKIYCPVRSRQTVMRIIFYCTDKREVDFVDDEGVY